MIANSVTSIGDWRSQSCTSLTGVYFQGNAPGVTNDESCSLGLQYRLLLAVYDRLGPNV